MEVMRYVALNPVRAGLAARLKGLTPFAVALDLVRGDPSKGTSIAAP
jgi:hypothetical protein